MAGVAGEQGSGSLDSCAPGPTVAPASPYSSPSGFASTTWLLDGSELGGGEVPGC